MKQIIGEVGTEQRSEVTNCESLVASPIRVVSMVTAGLWLLCVGLGKITEAPPQPRTENNFPH